MLLLGFSEHESWLPAAILIEAFQLRLRSKLALSVQLLPCKERCQIPRIGVTGLHGHESIF